LRGSSAAVVPAAGAALALALAATGAGCSPRTIVVVDPYLCSDGGASPCATGLLDGLVGYWRLDDPAGSPTARDWSGWGNDGTLVGLDPSAAWVAGGPEGRALSPQAKGYVNVAPSTSIDSITDQVTVAAWIYLDSALTDYATAISRQIGAGYEQHYHVSVNSQMDAALFITTSTAGKVFISSPMTVPLQTWVHIAGTYDGAMARLYVNGVEVNSIAQSGPFAAETNPVVLGGNGNTSTRAVSEMIPGLLDEVMLYRRALSGDELARIIGGALLGSGAGADGGASGD
jgi:hypothetical protein